MEEMRGWGKLVLTKTLYKCFVKEEIGDDARNMKQDVTF